MDFTKKLEKYFNETPKKKILEDWNKSKEWDKIGVDVNYFIENTKLKTKDHNSH